MNETDSRARVAPYTDDRDEFQRLVEPYRRELLIHCYRILGSPDDAEDALQETLLRAWRRLDSLNAKTSLRAWLYKIGTNVSLDMLDTRKARSLPNATEAPSVPRDALPAPITDPVWLGPLPDVYLDGHIVNPEARYEARESVTLAFLSVLQRLPGRQRAILIFRDVLGWKAQEVASLLELSVPAVNSALQRARTTMKKYRADAARHPAADSAATASLLARYVHAWETADAAALITLLREDAVLTMPPVPAWYRGRIAIRDFLEQHVFANADPTTFRLAATRANGCPAFAVYQRDADGRFKLNALQILTLASDQVAQIDDFLDLDGRSLTRFQLPLVIDR